MSRLLCVALLLAACIDKPPRPAGDGDEIDGGIDPDAGGGCGAGPAEPVMQWSANDEIRFNQQAGLIDGDCREDLVIPGSRLGGGAPGLFVVLGRETGFMTGYDEFYPTPGRIPVDLALADFVGDDEVLDLMVLADDQDLADTGHLIVFQGIGDGTFATPPQSNDVAMMLEPGTADFPLPTYIHVAQLETSGAPAALFGDSDENRALQPDDWEDMEGVTESAPPIGRGGEIVQELGLMPSGTPGVVDAYWLGVDNGRWCYNTDVGPDPFALGDLQMAAISGVGPGFFFDLEGDDDPDLVALRNSALEFQVVEPPGGPGEAGALTNLEFAGDATPLPSGYIDLAVARLADADEPELLLLDKESNDGGVTFEATRLTLFRDLVIEAQVRPAGPGIESTESYGATDTPPNRIVVGRFREGRQLIYLLPSRPENGLAFCRETAGEGDTLLLQPCEP